MFDDKVLMVTGGTGSFGNEVLQHFLATDVREIRVFSRDEKKQEDMRRAVNDPKVTFHIGDVRDYSSVSEALRGVDYVFHAAALKQVPTCEFHPMEAIRTNVLGAENVMNAALAQGVRRVVLLSTDKAVYPINAMGMSKALMEKLMIAKSRQRDGAETVLCATRYGNVMASRGSVIPLFIEQIKSGRPVTITDPAMTRFLMSLSDSVRLVLHAYCHARQGDIYIQKAPAATLGTLARALLRIFGGRPEHVRVIGTRHGEKLFESLVSREEMVKAEEDESFFRIPADNRDLNYAKYVFEGEPAVSAADDYTSHNTRQLTEAETVELLLTLPYVREQLNA